MTPNVSAKKYRGWIFWAAVIGLSVAVGWGLGQSRSKPKTSLPQGENRVAMMADPEAPNQNRAEMLFCLYCASCHGQEGRGDGPSAASIHPPPRDFSLRPWRFSVSKESIRTVIRDGIPGTAMPANRAAIASSDIDRLVDYTYELATSRPITVFTLSEKEKLLQTASFTDLGGSLPPRLTLSDALGSEVKLADLKGRLVLLHFWGANCPHCLKEMPALKALETEFSERGFTVVHICTDLDDVKEAQAVADRQAPALRIFTEASGLGLVQFEVQVLPSVWLIAPDGKAIGRSQGARDWSAPALRGLLEAWLPKSVQPWK